MRELHVLREVTNSYEWSYELLLYDQKKFQVINNDLPNQDYHLVDKKEQVIYGHVCFQFSEGKAISNIAAPFGGFSFHESMTVEDRLFFAIEVVRLLKAQGLSEIMIHQAPCTQLIDLAFQDRLRFLGFENISTREYQLIELIHSFSDGLHDMELRKLKKAKDKGFRFDLAPASKLKEVLDFVIEQRSILGYEFSMNWEQLREYQKAFPNKYLGARVWDDSKLIAASIMVVEHGQMIYQFAPAHLKTYNRYSPLVYLTSQVFSWASQQGYQWLNLGTSYVAEEKNEGLFRFKENLGAQSFIAPSLQKVITSLETGRN